MYREGLYILDISLLDLGDLDGFRNQLVSQAHARLLRDVFIGCQLELLAA